MTAQIWLALGVAVLSSASLFGILYAVFGPKLFGVSRVELRTQQLIQGTTPVASDAAADTEIKGLMSQRRRQNIQDRIKNLQQEQKGEALSHSTIEARLQQSGTGASKRHFVIFSVVSGVAFTLLFSLIGVPWYGLVLIAFAASLGLPRWLLSYLVRTRQNAFIAQFPDALDVLVRGVRAGLPLLDCLRIVANEGQDPVKAEFEVMAKGLAVGLTLQQALQQLHERIPLPEVNFFSIAVSMQQQSGGNLSEAISNLSKVLRERRRMRQKVVALSQEAKASAFIIGALPFVIMGLMYFISPGYLLPLFTETLGKILLIIGALWMVIGIFIMRAMVSFDI